MKNRFLKYFWILGFILVGIEAFEFVRLAILPLSDIYITDVKKGTLSPLRFSYTELKDKTRVKESDIGFAQSFFGPELMIGKIYQAHVASDQSVLFREGSWKYALFLICAFVCCIQLWALK